MKQGNDVFGFPKFPRKLGLENQYDEFVRTSREIKELQKALKQVQGISSEDSGANDVHLFELGEQTPIHETEGFKRIDQEQKLRELVARHEVLRQRLAQEASPPAEKQDDSH